MFDFSFRFNMPPDASPFAGGRSLMLSSKLSRHRRRQALRLRRTYSEGAWRLMSGRSLMLAPELQHRRMAMDSALERGERWQEL